MNCLFVFCTHISYTHFVDLEWTVWVDFELPRGRDTIHLLFWEKPIAIWDILNENSLKSRSYPSTQSTCSAFMPTDTHRAGGCCWMLTFMEIEPLLMCRALLLSDKEPDSFPHNLQPAWYFTCSYSTWTNYVWVCVCVRVRISECCRDN